MQVATTPGVFLFTQWFAADETASSSEVIAWAPGWQQLVPLTDSATNDFYPTTSPDGLTIALMSIDFTVDSGEISTWHLTLLDIDGANRRIVATLDLPNPQGLSWSPDGSRIAIGTMGYGEPGVYVIAADGTELEFVTSGIEPAWSPTGEQLVFSDWAEGSQDIFRIGADGSNRARLTGFSGEEWSPAWSRDGTHIAFATNHGTAFGDTDVWLMDSDGANQVRIIEHAGMDWGPTWSPDGDRIAWLSDRPDEPGLWSANIDGTDQEHMLLTQPAWMSSLVWAPAQHPFADVPLDHLFNNDVACLFGADITKGCNPPDNDKFCPNNYVTRGQMAAFLTRALGYTDDGGGNIFIDDNETIFETDIDKLAAAGVTKGCNPPDNDKYCPNNYVTRGQMAAFLHRAIG